MSRRGEEWPLSNNGARNVPGWDDGPTPPSRPDWLFAAAVAGGVLAWVGIAIALRAWGWL